MGFIVQMNDGVAVDGVYALREHAELMSYELNLHYGHRHYFRVVEVGKEFTVRGLKRIHKVLREHKAKPMTREYAEGYRDALMALQRLSFKKPEMEKAVLRRAWDELDTAWCIRSMSEGIK